MSVPPDSPDPAKTTRLQPGEVVGEGRYTLKQRLGNGGMGVVWLAHDKRLLEPVALKFLPPKIQADSFALDALRRETLRSRKLSHPNIVRIYDLHEAKGEPTFISMEYVDGPDLHLLRARRPSKVLPWTFLIPIVKQLCSALEYAHGERVIHRDLKPANVILDSNERVKLADFGLACVVRESVGSAPETTASGTLQYMSPQQADGHKPDVTDDIYALGATLYELLTSQQPFVTGDIAYQIKHNRPQAMQERLLDLELSNEIPSELCALVMACLAKEPSQRPQSARAILDWLETTQVKPSVGRGVPAEPPASTHAGGGVPAEPPALHRPAEPPPRPRSKPPTALPAKGSTPKKVAVHDKASPPTAADPEPGVAEANPPSSDAADAVAPPESSDFPEPDSTEPTALDQRRWVLRGLLLLALLVLAILLWKNNSPDTPPPPVPARTPPSRPPVTPPPAPATVAPIAPPEPARAALPEAPEVFENLFNGRDLTGWDGDPRYWTVTNGAIFGRFPSLVGGRQANTALFYRGAPVQDFELRFLFRSLSGSYDVIYRAREQPNFFATGYACTLWLGAGLVGGSHELFQGGTRGNTKEYFSSTEGKAALLEGDWNEVVITAQADRLRHEINGKLVCDARDASSSRPTSGTLALALNLVSSGTPNGIEFKDIRLKRLSPIPAATPEVSNPVVPPAASFVSLFNGRDLAGWSGDARLWSVRNGALVGNVSRASPTRRHFLFWRGGPVNDFELRMAFRLGSGAGNRGGFTGNSGLFYWARTLEPLFPGGLEYEIRAGAVGSMYFHQDSRTFLNEVTFDSSRLYRGDTWNEAVIIARGRTLVHQLNGVTVGTKTIDYVNFVPGGYLALEINHSAGWESYVEFQYISLKRL